MGRLDTEKLHVRLVSPVTEEGPVTPRRYTLTHSDRTGDLFLTIGPDYDHRQIRGWYTRLLRDEVLAEWIESTGNPEMHVYCQVGKGLGTTRFRESIFRRELPLVLEAFRYGDSRLFTRNPHLDQATIWIHFQMKSEEQDTVENWGKMAEYAAD
ncbi:MAG: staygreen family protein, partial [Candidatus Thorarchaeota archaeon]